jgi:hypothetical protein
LLGTEITSISFLASSAEGEYFRGCSMVTGKPQSVWCLLLTNGLTLLIQRAFPNTDTNPVLFNLQEDERRHQREKGQSSIKRKFVHTSSPGQVKGQDLTLGPQPLPLVTIEHKKVALSFLILLP